MIEGSKTYYLPNTDIEVEITYEIDGEDVVFRYAEIGGANLDCDMLGVTVDVTTKYDILRKTKQLTLKEWFQSKLNDDICGIFNYHDIVVKSNRDEHYPAGLI